MNRAGLLNSQWTGAVERRRERDVDRVSASGPQRSLVDPLRQHTGHT
jgi:hypothetical protein